MRMVQSALFCAPRWSRWLRSLFLLACCLAAFPVFAQQTLKTIELRAGMFRIEAELAVTERQRETGLMHRRSMPPHAGMLFVFERPQAYCFWMKNTLIPLSIAFLDDAGRIVNIARMQPQSEQSHCASQPVRYALEMNQGWFAEKGIRPGGRIQGLPGL